MVPAATSIENASTRVAISWAAISESPPRSKKLSWRVSRVTPSTCLKMAFSVRSTSVSASSSTAGSPRAGRFRLRLDLQFGVSSCTEGCQGGRLYVLPRLDEEPLALERVRRKPDLVALLARGSPGQEIDAPASHSRPAAPRSEPEFRGRLGRMGQALNDLVACSAPGCWRASVASVRPGPTSRSTRSGASNRVASASEKRTVLRMCAVQYPGSVSSPGAVQAPVVSDRKGMAGSRSAMRASRSSKAGTIGSTSEEWPRSRC